MNQSFHKTTFSNEIIFFATWWCSGSNVATSPKLQFHMGEPIKNLRL